MRLSGRENALLLVLIVALSFSVGVGYGHVSEREEETGNEQKWEYEKWGLVVNIIIAGAAVAAWVVAVRTSNHAVRQIAMQRDSERGRVVLSQAQQAGSYEPDFPAAFDYVFTVLGKTPVMVIRVDARGYVSASREPAKANFNGLRVGADIFRWHEPGEHFGTIESNDFALAQSTVLTRDELIAVLNGTMFLHFDLAVLYHTVQGLGYRSIARIRYRPDQRQGEDWEYTTAPMDVEEGQGWSD